MRTPDTPDTSASPDDRALTLQAWSTLDAGWVLCDERGGVLRQCERVTDWLGPLQAHVPLFQHVHPEDQRQPEQAGDRRWRTPDGRWRWLAHRPISHGVGTLHVLQDIDARKLQELQAADSAALLDSLRQHLPGVFYKIEADAQGAPRVTFVNEGVRELLGYTPAEVETDFRRIFDRVHPDDRERFNAIVANALRTDADTVFEYRVIVPGKGVRHLAGRGCSAMQSSGRLARFGYQHDVTEQKLYQDALLKARAAEQASEVKSEFLSRMSHELRTPLNAILGFSQLLKLSTQEPLGAEQKGRVDLIERAGQHLLGLVNDVLDLSRIEAGHMALHLGAVGVSAAFDEAINLVLPTAHAHQVTVHRMSLAVDVHGPLAVEADMLRLQQVLVNLLTNAIKYNRPGGQVWLSVQGLEPESASDEAAASVELVVRDDGQGMTEAQLAHLFEPFNRLGAEQTSVDGSGIGLVIVRRLVELMHGELAVRSAPNQGTQVVIRLPRARAVPASPSMPPVEALPAASSRVVDVLCVEDNEVNIALLAGILELRPACRLRVARSGREALSMLASGRPDLMLVDMHLGDMSGLELARRIDEAGLADGVPRVVLSADAMSATIQEARSAGFVAYVTKPLEVRPFLATLDQVIAGLRPA